MSCGFKFHFKLVNNTATQLESLLQTPKKHIIGKKWLWQEHTYARLRTEYTAIFRHHVRVLAWEWNDSFLRFIRRLFIEHAEADVHSFCHKYPPAHHTYFILRSLDGSSFFLSAQSTTNSNLAISQVSYELLWTLPQTTLSHLSCYNSMHICK